MLVDCSRWERERSKYLAKLMDSMVEQYTPLAGFDSNKVNYHFSASELEALLVSFVSCISICFLVDLR